MEFYSELFPHEIGPRFEPRTQVHVHRDAIFWPHLEFFLDFSSEVIAQFFQFLWQRRMREVGLNPIFDAQFVQQRQAEVVLEIKVRKNK